MEEKYSGLQENIKLALKGFEGLNEAIEKMYELLPGASYELSKHGWFVDSYMSPGQIVELKELLLEDSEKVDKWFINHFNKTRIREIKERLISNYPKREDILKRAFERHKKKDYISSIILLLAQADGIFNDETSNKFFNYKEKRKGVKYISPENKNNLLDLLMEPMIIQTSINAQQDKICEYPIRLNRHEIIHGVDTNYSSKINSLKVVSFINYIDEIIYFTKRRSFQ